jgi:single-strand DNA-binding protein
MERQPPRCEGKTMTAATADPGEGSFNVAVVRGALTADVRVSDLPAGGVVHNFEVRAGAGDERHTVPVAWHDPVRPPKLRRGDQVVVIGAVRRRWFRAGGGSRSRTELVARSVAKAGSLRIPRMLEEAAATLHASHRSEG